MKPFINGKWHAWDSAPYFLLSDEGTKTLRKFRSADEAINWLFLNGAGPTARALNAHVKASFL